VWRREATKQVLDRAHDAKFDAMYEKMIAEKGLQSKQTTKKWTVSQLKPKVITDYVQLKINLQTEDDLHQSEMGKSSARMKGQDDGHRPYPVGRPKLGRPISSQNQDAYDPEDGA
jgi:hypothetical protein